MRDHSRRRVLMGVGAFLLLLGTAAAQILSTGALSLIMPFFASGGGGAALSGDGVVLTHSIGQGSVVPMAGGTLQLTPGIFGAAATASPNLETTHAFPTPFKPSLGHDRITFRGLTGSVTIRIYTLSGELAATLTKKDPTSGDLIWYPVANSAGAPLASGVYFYVVQDENGRGRVNGKIMIIK